MTSSAVVNAAREIGAVLTDLLGARAADVRRELEALLQRAAAGEDVTNALLALLRRHEETRQWLIARLRAAETIDALAPPDSPNGDEAVATEEFALPAPADEGDAIVIDDISAGVDATVDPLSDNRRDEKRQRRRARHPTARVAHSTAARARTQRARPTQAAPTARPRYAVVSVATADVRARSVPDIEALRVGAQYDISVAVSERFRGIRPAGGRTRAIQEPGSADTLPITVVAISDDFEIVEPVDTLHLPPSGDSTTASFRVRPLHATAGARRSVIRFKLLYRVNLIEDVELRARVLGQGAPARAAAGSLTLGYARLQELTGLAALTPKMMHVHVGRSEGAFVFYFIVAPEGQRVQFTGRSSPRLETEEVAQLLVRARSALLAIALERTDEATPDGVSATFRREARALAETGRDVWNALFKREIGSALFDIGGWLTERPLDEGAAIQVTVDADAAGCVLPWNLLYDRQLPADPLAQVDPDAFWGMRYAIEQHLPPLTHMDAAQLSVPSRGQAGYARRPLHATLVVGDFAQSAEQEGFFTQLAQRGAIALDGGGPIDTAPAVLAALARCSSELVCFFTHGHTAVRPSDIGSASLADAAPTAAIAASPDASARADRWVEATRRLTEEVRSRDSWIRPRQGFVKLRDLYDLEPPGVLTGAPVVLLNMCESAQVTPGLSESFIEYFIDRHARAVIGTETSTTPRFAHEVVAGLLSLFLDEKVELGEALRRMRQRYGKEGDLFGLVYTLFGDGSVHVARTVG